MDKKLTVMLFSAKEIIHNWSLFRLYGLLVIIYVNAIQLFIFIFNFWEPYVWINLLIIIFLDLRTDLKINGIYPAHDTAPLVSTCLWTFKDVIIYYDVKYTFLMSNYDRIIGAFVQEYNLRIN